jgi:hypothetical protein
VRFGSGCLDGQVFLGVLGAVSEGKKLAIISWFPVFLLCVDGWYCCASQIQCFLD